MPTIRGITDCYLVRNVPCGYFRIDLLVGHPLNPEHSGEFIEFFADRPAKDMVPENWCVMEDQYRDLLLIDGTMLYRKENMVTDGDWWWHKNDPDRKWPTIAKSKK